jgi:hypothetical protein
MNDFEQQIEMGSYSDKRSLERQVRYLGYMILAWRRRVDLATNLEEVELLADHILKLELFKEEFENLKNQL